MTEVLAMGKSPAKTRWLASLRRRRRLWLEVHRWLGLVAGAFLVVIALSGSALVYFREIDAWLNPELLVVKAPQGDVAAYRPMSEIVAAAQRATPADFRLGFAYYPRNRNEAVMFYASRRVEKGKRSTTTNVFVDPYTARVTGTRVYSDGDSILRGSLTEFLFKLHPSLLLGTIGSTIVGGLCVLFIVSILSGLILWWPITGKWRLGFFPKRNASPVRFNHDVHKLVGFYALPVLLAVMLSGVYLNLRPQFRWLVEWFSPLTRMESVSASSRPNADSNSIDQVLDTVRQRFPDGQVYTFSLPSMGKVAFPYAVTQLVPAGCCFVGRRSILLDGDTGKILQVGNPLEGGGGDVFIQWQLPVHSGYALGELGRIMAFLSGVGCTVLYVTGFRRWLQRRRSRMRAGHRLAGDR